MVARIAYFSLSLLSLKSVTQKCFIIIFSTLIVFPTALYPKINDDCNPTSFSFFPERNHFLFRSCRNTEITMVFTVSSPLNYTSQLKKKLLNAIGSLCKIKTNHLHRLKAAYV
ncbi:hypothetical protein T08_15721 [Trichinella sp. T8]|nr:hypothetical protein T08_15721 [Trichinella sp. T8]